MTTTTVTVPIMELPDLYLPVAQAAHELPAGSYGVVVWDEGRPHLAAAPIGMSTVAACELADAYRGLKGCRVFVVRRGRDCVTVHTADMAHPGNLIGTTPAPLTEDATHAPTTADGYWLTLVNRIMHDRAAQDDHDANITAAMRRVHNLADTVSQTEVWSVMLRAPRDGREYVQAFTQLLYAGEHLAGRLYRTHI